MRKRNKVISPYFDETAYKGQDVVHWGVRVPLHGMLIAEVLRSFSRRAQRIIDEKSPVHFRKMTAGDLGALRLMWFDPQDETFPTDMDDHVGVTALLGDEIVGGAIWSPQGKNLFLHQLVAGQKGKDLGVPTRLIWASVQEYWLKYHSLDIGVSYNPQRYEFFKNFAVETYPIILKRPFYVPVIRLSPFRHIHDLEEQRTSPPKDLAMTVLPRGNYALEAALRLELQDGHNNVVIIKTFGSDFISGCVTSTIEKVGYSWKLRGELNDRSVVVVVHEFGIPVFQPRDLEAIEKARSMGLPIIEDCAWRYGPATPGAKYQVYSMQKMYDINYGGILFGAKIDPDILWSWGMRDFVKEDRIEFEQFQEPDIRIRRDLWRRYHAHVVADGMEPDDCYDYAQAVEDGRWTPTVYLQKFEDEEIADAIVERLEDFGIQAGRYWGEPVVYLPIHQSMTGAEVDYMFGVVRGYFNLCRDFGAIMKPEVNHED